MPTDIISLTEFKNDASGWIERLQSQPPVVLTQNGRGRAVVLSYEAYRQMRNEMAMLQIVAMAEADIRADRTIAHEQVMADVHALLARDADATANAPKVARKSRATKQRA